MLEDKHDYTFIVCHCCTSSVLNGLRPVAAGVFAHGVIGSIANIGTGTTVDLLVGILLLTAGQTTILPLIFGE